MIYRILTQGWILRCCIILLWLAALVLRFYIEEDRIFGVAMIIGFSNAFLYLSIAFRLVSLSHHAMAGLIPDYFTQLKKALAVLLLLSFIPTLIVMPHFTLWLSVLSCLLFTAIVFVAMTYQPKVYSGFLLLFFIPYSKENFTSLFVGVDFIVLFAFALPMLAIIAYYLLTNLQKFKGDAKHIEKMMVLLNAKASNTVISQDKVPLKLRNKFLQWLINNNFSHYRQVIQSGKNISNTQRLAVACQSVSTIGRYTYLFWGIAAVIFSLLGSYFDVNEHSVILPVMVVLPIIMIGSGTFTLFQVINSKRRFLQRLAIMPCFTTQHSFSLAFIRYVVGNQLALYGFILLVIAFLVSVFHHLTLTMYINIVLACFILFLFNLTLMFWTWSSKRQFEGLVNGLMIIAFMLPTLLLIEGYDNLVLWQSPIFIASGLMILGLFSASAYRSYQYGLQTA